MSSEDLATETAHLLQLSLPVAGCSTSRYRATVLTLHHMKKGLLVSVHTSQAAMTKQCMQLT